MKNEDEEKETSAQKPEERTSEDDSLSFRAWLANLTGPKIPRRSSCCGGFVVEEVPEKESGPNVPSDPPKPKKNSCCG